MRRFAGLAALGAGLLACAFAAASPPLPLDYPNYEQLTRRARQLHGHEGVELSSLGKTAAGREIHLLTFSQGDAAAKPALLVVGGVHAPHLVGSELALRLAEDLASRLPEDERLRKLLERYTVYVVPRASPDAMEKCFQAPLFEHVGNESLTDDDRDFRIGEDPPLDLNGDGLITQLRIEDPAGTHLSHPDDPRVMIAAERQAKNERGTYRLLTEGRDLDEDEQIAEDGSGGVSLNRNFTFDYPYFKRAAGPHQVSEPESRALADFAFAHPNITVVLTFTPEDNLMQPWKPDAEGQRGRIKRSLLPDDVAYQNFLAERYRDQRQGKEPPASPDAEGAFAEWVYYHYGRWSLAARGWWIPPVEQEKTEQAAGEKEAAPPKKSDEQRGQEDIKALRWFEQQGIEAFVPWTPVEHPDFPERSVEVGGFKPLYQLNPPVSELDALARVHFEYVQTVLELLPELQIREVKVDALGGEVYRVRAKVLNRGYLPTMSEMGEVNRQVQALQAELDAPEATQWLQGARRVFLPRLAGNGGEAEVTWLLRLPNDAPRSLRLRVFAPSVGQVEAEVTMESEANVSQP